MKPYYQDSFSTIYHGNCLEIIPALPKADLLLTDPPYGIAWKRGANKARNSKPHLGIQNDSDCSFRDAALASVGNVPSIVFGSFYAPFPAALKQVLLWHKPSDSGLVGSVTGFRRDAEPIFLCGPWPVRKCQFSSVFRVLGGQSKVVKETGHPHTKPLPLIKLLLSAVQFDLVLDPFFGSGTTMVAAKQLGKRSIGVEIEEAFCEVAARRLSQEYLL